jgi:hypothetical protein
VTRKPTPTKRAPKGRPPSAVALRIVNPPDPVARREVAARQSAFLAEIADPIERGEPLDATARLFAVAAIRGFAARMVGAVRRSRGRPPAFDPGTVALEVAAAVILQRVHKTRALADAALRYEVSEGAIERRIRGHYAAAVALVRLSGGT